jgi:hypothetical protein
MSTVHCCAHSEQLNVSCSRPGMPVRATSYSHIARPQLGQAGALPTGFSDDLNKLDWGIASLLVLPTNPRQQNLFPPQGVRHVRFGSKADMCSAPTHVRFASNSDRESGAPREGMSALPPIADMCGATSDVRFGPIADILEEFGKLRLSGFPAWALWSVAYVYFLIGFRNRFGSPSVGRGATLPSNVAAASSPACMRV